MTRWKAASVHLSISAAIGMIVGALLLLVWYPPPYFHAGGADELILLLVGVDLTLGPLLTLIVFRSGKPGLRFDLATIGIVQTVALVYGLSVVLQSRPVFLVGVLDRFVLISANEITDDDLVQGSEPRFRSRSWTGPRLVGAVVPTDPKEKSDLVFSAFKGRDVQNLPKYYRDYADCRQGLLAHAKTLDKLQQEQPQYFSAVTTWLKDEGRAPTTIVWLPLQARKDDLILLLDAQTGDPVRPFASD